MDNKKFNKNLLERIKKENIKQIPKYTFVFKNFIMWFFLIISIMLWALSLSISFDYLINADWYLFRRIWLFNVLAIFLPLFWLLFLIFSSLLSYYNYRHTDRGYKLSLWKVFILNIVSSFVLAIILYFTWANTYIESKLEEYIPKYRSVLVDDKISRMIKVWQNEEQWLLIWEILEVWKNILILKDSNGKNWNITINNISNTDIKNRVTISIWEKVKIIWEKKEYDQFEAIEIRPFIWKWKDNLIEIIKKH